MTRKLTSRPVPVPEAIGPVCVPTGAWWGRKPAIRSAIAPNASGASACAIERRNVRVDSARPHRPEGMMSRRAASSGGLAAEISAVPKKQKNTDVDSDEVSSPGINITPAPALQRAGTQTRAARLPRLVSMSTIGPTARVPNTAPTTSTPSTSVASLWLVWKWLTTNRVAYVSRPEKKK